MFIKRGIGKITSIVEPDEETTVEENTEETVVKNKVAHKSIKMKTIVDNKNQKNN